MKLKDHPWECDICRRYARLIVIALEMSCNLSGRCDDLKKSDLVKYVEDGETKYLKDELSSAEYYRKYWKDKALVSADELSKLKAELNEEKAVTKRLSAILRDEEVRH